jgi:hypothetical protein
MAMEGKRTVEELETLLRRFKEEGAPEEKRVEVKLEDPLLLLVAQHRRFRICRRTPFCPDEHCRSKKKILTFGRLAIHFQLEYITSKEDAIDMTRYSITKRLPRSIKTIVRTRTGELQVEDRRWSFWEGHHPGCTYM